MPPHLPGVFLFIFPKPAQGHLLSSMTLFLTPCSPDLITAVLCRLSCSVTFIIFHCLVVYVSICPGGQDQCLIGLFTFVLFFINVCKVCINQFENVKFLFIAIFLLNCCVWIKVSTDLFVVFAPFLCIPVASAINVVQSRMNLL